MKGGSPSQTGTAFSLRHIIVYVPLDLEGRNGRPATVFAMHKSSLILALVAVLGLVGCNRDPQVAKKKYYEAGAKYLDQGKLKEASLMFRNALKKDARYGDAYWKLGETELRRGDVSEAARALRRAVELLPNNPEPASRLAEIYLGAYNQQRQKDKRLLDETADIANTLLKRDPKSFYGLRLKGFLATVNRDWKSAEEYLRQADAVKPDQPDLRLALSQILAATGQWPESEAIAKKLLADHKDYAGTYDFLFGQYVNRKDQAAADQILAQRVQAFPKVAGYQLQQAAFFYSTQRQAQAEQILQKMLGNPADFPDGRLAVADFYFRTREYDKALRFYREGADAAKEGDKKTQYRIRQVLALAAANKTEDALALADQVVKEQPKNTDALQLRASLILQAGRAKGNEKRYQEAINDLQAVISRTPSNPFTRVTLARAYQSRGDIDAALVQYQEATKLRPDFLAAQIGLGQVLLAKGEGARALQTSDEILRLDPNNLAGKVLRNASLMRTGNLKQARTDLENALKTAPNQPDLAYQLAILDFNEKRFKEAEDGFKRLRAAYPGDTRLLLALTEINLATGRTDAALQMLEDELKKSPDRDDVRLALARAAMRTNHLDLATEQFKLLIAKNPNNFEYYMRLSDTLRLKGDAQASLDAVKKGQALAPNHPLANLQLAMTYESMGDRSAARPYYETVLKSEPDNPIALNNLAYMMAEEGRDLDQALTYAQRAKQKAANNDEIADTLGWIYIKKNLSDPAIDIFKGLVVKQPKNSTFHYHLAMALYQKGDKAKAKQSLQTALSLKPGKDEENKIRELMAKVG